MAGDKENALKRRKCDDGGKKHKLIRTAATALAFNENVSANFNQSSSVVIRQSASSSTASFPATRLKFFELNFARNTAARWPRRPKLDVSVLKKTKSTHDDYACSKRVGLEGRKHVDFMHYLGERYNFIVVIEKILSFLDGEDLTSMSQVSHTWCDLINRSLEAKQKQASYRSWARSDKENQQNPERSLSPVSLGEKTRKVLNDVTNVDARPSSSNQRNHPPLKFGVLEFLLT